MDLIKVNISSLEQSINSLRALEKQIPVISGVRTQGKGEAMNELKTFITDLNELGSSFKQTVHLTAEALSNAKEGFLDADEKTAQDIRCV